MKNKRVVSKTLAPSCLWSFGVVSSALVVQMAILIAGIQGANYIFTIIMALQTSFSLLLYQERKCKLP